MLAYDDREYDEYPEEDRYGDLDSLDLAIPAKRFHDDYADEREV